MKILLLPVCLLLAAVGPLAANPTIVDSDLHGFVHIQDDPVEGKRREVDVYFLRSEIQSVTIMVDSHIPESIEYRVRIDLKPPQGYGFDFDNLEAARAFARRILFPSETSKPEGDEH